MAEVQVKKGQKQASGCRHFLAYLDAHHYCPSCRDKGKGGDVCVVEKQEDCCICLQFTPDQLKKLKAKKVRRKIKEGSISKELENSLLGVESSNSSSASNSAPNSSASVSPSSDALQLILAKLDNMQGRISSLVKASILSTSTTSSATSKEAVMAEFTSDHEGDRHRDRHSTRRFNSEEDDTASLHDISEVRAKRHRSPSPGLPDRKEEELDEDPSYRQFLSMVRSLLDLPTVDEAAEAPSKIFASRDRNKRKLSVLPVSLPPVDEITERWKALENKAEGNLRSEDVEKLRSTPFNRDSFLPYSRPLMKFYKTTTSEFSTVDPKCQDSFKGICSRFSSIPSSISIPAKQCIVMEEVKREHVQMVGFVSLFLKTLEKCASNMEEIVHGL